jgi:hypothetical protein
MSMDDVLPRKPAHDVELRHGYTLSQLNALSVWTVMHDRYCSFADVDERLEVVWHAIVEHLYTTAEVPARQDLVLSGWRAIREYVQKDARFRGTTSPARRPEKGMCATGIAPILRGRRSALPITSRLARYGRT